VYNDQENKIVKRVDFNMPMEGSNNKVKKIVAGIVIIFVSLLIILGIVGYIFYNSALEPINAESDEVVEVTIPSGSTRADIARTLEEDGVIESAFVFNTHVRINDETGFQAGYFEMSPSMSVPEVVDYLQQGGEPIPGNQNTVTIPEGVTIDRTGEIINKQTPFSKQEFVDLIQNESFIEEKTEEFNKLLSAANETNDEMRYTLEGYLFPATYEFNQDTSLEELVTQMISTMDQVMSSYYDEIDNHELNVHETITLASIIEREAVTTEDRKTISGVFYNRLEAEMPLQTDVSVSYALQKHKERISYDDIEIDSPYNLYIHTGLGPGPVNSPSKQSINAALNPNDTNYMYFLADLGSGNVYFSETYEQHLEYQNEYLSN